MSLRNTFAILLSFTINLASNTTAFGIGLDNVQATVLDNTSAAQLSGLGDQIGLISYGEPVTGALGDDSDAFNNTGIAYDLYSFTVDNSWQPYVISASSSSFIIAAALYHYEPAQATLTPLQVIVNLQSNGQIQFSGILNQKGQYLIQIISGDAKTGAYELRLDEQIPLPEAPVGMGGEPGDGATGDDPFGGFDGGFDNSAGGGEGSGEFPFDGEQNNGNSGDDFGSENDLSGQGEDGFGDQDFSNNGNNFDF